MNIAMCLKRATVLSLIGGGLILMGCSHRASKTDSAMTEAVSAENTQVAREAGATYFTEVKFKEGSRQLTAESKDAIASLIQKASTASEGGIDEIKVLSWSDREYPSEQTKKLSSDQRRLAKERNKSIENYIDSFRGTIDVDTYSMAEQPNVVKKWLNTPDARLKNSLAAAGIPMDSSAEINGRASTALIMAIVDYENRRPGSDEGSLRLNTPRGEAEPGSQPVR